MTENPWILFAAGPLAAYVIGSTPFGVLLARLRGVDLRAVGSGNVGATNVARALGRKWGYFCFFCDVAKGAAPTLAACLLLRDRPGFPTATHQAAWLCVGLGAVLGHVLSFWLRFRGGKGVATSLGVMLGIWPYFTYAGLVAFGVWVAVTLTSRYVSLGSIVAALAVLPVMIAINYLAFDKTPLDLWPLLAFAAAMAALIVLRHRANIRRLLAGTESKIGRKKA